MRRLQAGGAVDRGVFGEARVDRADRRVLDVLRGVEVGLAGAEADDVAAFGLERGGAGRDGQGGGGLDGLYAAGEFQVVPSWGGKMVRDGMLLSTSAARFYLCSSPSPIARSALFQPFPPAGDQPEAIDQLVEGIEDGLSYQTLLGVTGSGKTYTMANVIARTGRPALIMAPNKTLAAQLYSEMREFFPENAVEYFVSYYDYYQPEAYVPSRDLFIEKDSSINEHIEQMRCRRPSRCWSGATP
jgi:hypothetical protein